MRLSTSLLIPASLLAMLASGCATPESRGAAYDQALSQWQGASEETLRARWGKPVAEEPAGHGRWLTYVVYGAPTPPPTVSFSIGGFGFGGGRTSVGGGVGVTTPVGQATQAACTTHFLVEDGKVSSWNYEGAGCGAS